MKIIKGDLIQLAKDGKFDAICHGCNCQKTMGAGIALQIKNNFKTAWNADLNYENPQLGEISIGSELFFDVINCYSQINVGKPSDFTSYNNIIEDTSEARYDAIQRCFEKINGIYHGKSIGVPLIGCGLAGLDWHRVRTIIAETLTDVDVTVVAFDDKDYQMVLNLEIELAKYS